MRVKLQRDWFAPVDTGNMSDKRVVSGSLYKAGIHENMPDELQKRLPKGAEVLDKDYVAEVEEATAEPQTLSEVGPDRAAADQEAAMVAEAEAQRERNEEVRRRRNEGLARARAAKKAKAANKKGE